MATDIQGRETGPVRLRVCGLTRRYGPRRGPWSSSCPVRAADQVSFEIPPGKTLALVGSSGSGKSTVARCVTRLEKPDAGEIWMGETDIAGLASRSLAPFRAKLQMIFQDSASSMNPRLSAAEVIEEPLLIQKRGSREERRTRVVKLMNEVRVLPAWMDRPVMEFSGGQRQRIAIARALALAPGVLVLDEAFSGLDVSTQAQIANLLLELQTAYSLTCLLISHDLGLVARLADSIAVMSEGRIVEQGPTPQIISRAEHQQTRTLLAAARTFYVTHAAARGASL